MPATHNDAEHTISPSAKGSGQVAFQQGQRLFNSMGWHWDNQRGIHRWLSRTLLQCIWQSLPTSSYKLTVGQAHFFCTSFLPQSLGSSLVASLMWDSHGYYHREIMLCWYVKDCLAMLLAFQMLCSRLRCSIRTGIECCRLSLFMVSRCQSWVRLVYILTCPIETPS